MISIRRIKPGEGMLFRRIRLDALQESPDAFGSTYESAIARASSSWAEQADTTATGPDRATFLLFENDTPAGLIAIYRDETVKHRGEIIQLWIAPHLRGSGAAADLTHNALEWAKVNGFTQAIADVFDHNKRSLGFFHKFGFHLSDDLALKRDGHQILEKRLKNQIEPK